jgi:hypothetical protein
MHIGKNTGFTLFSSPKISIGYSISHSASSTVVFSKSERAKIAFAQAGDCLRATIPT